MINFFPKVKKVFPFYLIKFLLKKEGDKSTQTMLVFPFICCCTHNHSSSESQAVSNKVKATNKTAHTFSGNISSLRSQSVSTAFKGSSRAETLVKSRLLLSEVCCYIPSVLDDVGAVDIYLSYLQNLYNDWIKLIYTEMTIVKALIQSQKSLDEVITQEYNKIRMLCDIVIHNLYFRNGVAIEERVFVSEKNEALSQGIPIINTQENLSSLTGNIYGILTDFIDFVLKKIADPSRVTNGNINDRVIQLERDIDTYKRKILPRRILSIDSRITSIQKQYQSNVEGSLQEIIFVSHNDDRPAITYIFGHRCSFKSMSVADNTAYLLFLDQSGRTVITGFNFNTTIICEYDTMFIKNDIVLKDIKRMKSNIIKCGNTGITYVLTHVGNSIEEHQFEIYQLNEEFRKSNALSEHYYTHNRLYISARSACAGIKQVFYKSIIHVKPRIIDIATDCKYLYLLDISNLVITVFDQFLDFIITELEIPDCFFDNHEVQMVVSKDFIVLSDISSLHVWRKYDFNKTCVEFEENIGSIAITENERIIIHFMGSRKILVFDLKCDKNILLSPLRSIDHTDFLTDESSLKFEVQNDYLYVMNSCKSTIRRFRL